MYVSAWSERERLRNKRGWTSMSHRFFPVMSWSCWGLDVGLLLVCLFDCPGLCIPGRWIEKNHLPRRHLKYTKKKAGRGLWGKMKALWQKNLFAYGGSDESFWSRPTAPNWLNTRHCGPPQAYILGVIERSGGIFGRKLKERDWGPKLAGRKTQLHMGHRVWLGYPTIFPLNSGCT